MRRIVVTLIGLLLSVSCAQAHGHRHHHATRHHARHHRYTHIASADVVQANNFGEGLGYGLIHMLNSAGPRPRAWCGWEMRRELGVSDASYNLARNWTHYGHAAFGPAVGVVVVWPHHVGRIVGGEPGAWVVHSGNDGHAVRERVRSLAGVIAYRSPG